MDLNQVIDQRIFQALQDFFTMGPAKIAKIDVETGFVDLDYLHLGQDQYGKYTEVFQLVDVPVMRLGGDQNFLSFPLELGAFGACLFTKQDLNIFKRSGGKEIQKPTDPALDNINGAFFLPGGLRPAKAHNNSVVELAVGTDKKLKIGNENFDVMAMFDLIHQIISGMFITYGTNADTNKMIQLQLQISAGKV